MPFIIDDVEWHILLRTHQNFVDKRNTGNPVPIQHLAITLNVVLTAGEVPHEVAPIHEIQLIREEELQVFRECRFHYALHLSAIVIFHRLAFYLRPVLVGLYMARVGTVHTWEQHVQFVDIFVFLIGAGHEIAVFLVFILLDHTAPGRFALCRDRHAASSLILALHFRNVGLSVEERGFTILFTCQIRTQRKDIARRVLVHWRVGRCTDQCQCIRRIAHDDYHQADQDRVQRLDIHLLAFEQVQAQRCRQDDRQNVAASDKRNTDQNDRQDESNFHACRMDLVAHGFPDRPDQYACHNDHISKYSGIVRHA